ncbi:hypothetical protein RFI_26147 [Reticulomyxa filosa]|uniref:Uncharacterized protein n=1 Tax=Reticulomyxa filosa TaxID=46433 RepID=X6MBH8_RETFI|nr:hypothetical protein RFI_26147 [Reticulomyxa filosa]|eukprot:ETO11229.1 hypothetical protein RFI_26147 [Reticulomyxa filosa]
MCKKKLGKWHSLYQVSKNFCKSEICLFCPFRVTVLESEGGGSAIATTTNKKKVEMLFGGLEGIFNYHNEAMNRHLRKTKKTTRVNPPSDWKNDTATYAFSDNSRLHVIQKNVGGSEGGGSDELIDEDTEPISSVPAVSPKDLTLEDLWTIFQDFPSTYQPYIEHLSHMWLHMSQFLSQKPKFKHFIYKTIAKFTKGNPQTLGQFYTFFLFVFALDYWISFVSPIYTSYMYIYIYIYVCVCLYVRCQKGTVHWLRTLPRIDTLCTRHAVENQQEMAPH